MNDILSFFRYFLPGIIYFILISISMLIYDFNEAMIFFTKYEIISANLFAGIAFAGGLGFIFSLIYRLLFPIHGINHLPTLLYLLDNKLVVINEWNDKQNADLRSDNQKNRKVAHEILNIIWHFDGFKFDKDKTNFHSNFLNSIGSCIMSSMLAFFTFCFISPFAFSEIDIIFLFICSIPILCLSGLFYYHHNRAKADYEVWMNSTLIMQLRSVLEKRCDYAKTQSPAFLIEGFKHK